MGATDVWVWGGQGEEVEKSRSPGPQLQKGQAAIFNPSLGWSGDLVSGRRDGEKGRMPEAHRHLIPPGDLYSLALRVGSPLRMDGRNKLRGEPL